MKKPDLALARLVRDSYEAGTLMQTSNAPLLTQAIHNDWLVIVAIVDTYDYEVTELGLIVFNMLDKPEETVTVKPSPITAEMLDDEPKQIFIDQLMEDEIARLREQITEQQVSIKELNDRLDEYNEHELFWRQDVVTLKRQLGEARLTIEHLTGHLEAIEHAGLIEDVGLSRWKKIHIK